MSDDSIERGAARRMGFGRPASRFSVGSGTHPADNLPIVERLGLRSGWRVALIGVTDAGLTGMRSGNSLKVSSMVPLEPVDAVIYQVDSSFALRRVGELSKLVRSGGVLWILWPTVGRNVTAAHIERAGNAAGMKCTWTMGVTGLLTGMKFIHRFADGR